MKLAVIAPPEQLHHVQGYGLSYHMALGQELARNPGYCNWYKWRHAFGDFIMVDNGAAEPEEERIPFDTILEHANYIGADEIILPDELYDADKTIALITDTLLLSSVPARNRMVVPQGSSFDEWRQCFKQIRSIVDFRAVGIPKHMEKTAASQGGRAGILRWMRNERFDEDIDVHLLGVWEKPIAEVSRALQTRVAVRGIDTGAPIAYAQQEATINDYEHHSLDWTAPAPFGLVRDNIRILLNACMEMA